jgi:hypothetical protein
MQGSPADDWYRNSLAVSDELGYRLGIASTYHQVGRTEQASGPLEEADDWFLKSLIIV